MFSMVPSVSQVESNLLGSLLPSVLGEKLLHQRQQASPKFHGGPSLGSGTPARVSGPALLYSQPHRRNPRGQQSSSFQFSQLWVLHFFRGSPCEMAGGAVELAFDEADGCRSRRKNRANECFP